MKCFFAQFNRSTVRKRIKYGLDIEDECNDFYFRSMENTIYLDPLSISSLSMASSTLVCELSHIATSGVCTVKQDFGCNLNVPLISFDVAIDFTGINMHPKNSLRLEWRNKEISFNK